MSVEPKKCIKTDGKAMEGDNLSMPVVLPLIIKGMCDNNPSPLPPLQRAKKVITVTPSTDASSAEGLHNPE